MSASPADFVAFENAIVAWLRAVTGYDANHVYLADQDGNDRGDGARVVVQLGELRPVGLDAARWAYDAGQSAGQEMVNTTDGLRFLECTLFGYSPTTTGSSATARAVLSAVVDSLALDTYRDALNAAGLGVLSVSAVKWVPKVAKASFEGRAMLELRFTLRVSAEEKTGYIDRVIGSGTVQPGPVTLPYDVKP